MKKKIGTLNINTRKMIAYHHFNIIFRALLSFHLAIMKLLSSGELSGKSERLRSRKEFMLQTNTVEKPIFPNSAMLRTAVP